MRTAYRKDFPEILRSLEGDVPQFAEQVECSIPAVYKWLREKPHFMKARLQGQLDKLEREHNV